MEGGEGMVAVVRGLRDSGLAVTLLDGCRQYTLMPNAVQPPPSPTPPPQPPTPTHVHILQHGRSRTQESLEPPAPRTDSAAQATDGRYASMYKTAHCSVTPTSPPVQLTEFPPQRAELCRGHGNFEVGGSGSGENYTPCRSNGSFRGAMSWPDRGSVCSPRPSREPDAFANSLRKYPNVSVERSTEMVERLITYTQAKNISKTYRYPSPSRHTDSNTSNQYAIDRNASRNTAARSGSYQRTYEPEVTVSKVKPRMEEAPTRDLRDNEFGDYRRHLTKEKYMKDSSRKVKEHLRYLSTYPYNQPISSPGVRERYERNNLSEHKTPSVLTATNSVNMEVQAAAEMVSKEVSTVPRTEPPRRNVAVPLSPTSSSDDQKPEGDVSRQRQAEMNFNTSDYDSKNIPTTSSSIGDKTLMRKCRCLGEEKTKSEENLHKNFGDEMFELLDKVSICPNSDPQAHSLRREVLKEMSTKLQRMTENIDWNEGIEDTRNKIGKLLKYVPVWIPYGDVQAYKDAISDEILNRMNRFTMYDVYRTETHYTVSNDERNLNNLLRTWISNIPFQSYDILGKPVEKERISEVLLYRLKRLIQNRHENEGSSNLKSEILNIISKLPIAVNEFTRPEYLNNLVDTLILKFKLKNQEQGHDRMLTEPCFATEKTNFIADRLKRYIQPTEEEIKACIYDELKHFLQRTCSKSCSDDIKDLEIEIVDFMIDSVQALRSGKDYFVESELIMLLCQEIDTISWYEARQISQRLIELVKNMFSFNASNRDGLSLTCNQTRAYVVLQNSAQTCPHNSPNPSDDFHNPSQFSIESVSKGDTDADSEAYMNQLTAQIEEWLASLPMQIPQANDSGFRQVVVHDLAGDIIDRHKYLELNPSSKVSNSDELDHLKYQIFKWINKLAGEDNMETIDHAPELMQRIQSIPVPMFTKSPQTNTEAGSCCPQSGPTVNNTMPRTENNKSQVLSMPANNSRFNASQSRANHDMSASCCSSTHLKPSTPSMKQLNEDYDEFLKKWVQEIPIPSSTAAEKALVDKARLGIYNGVWKAITKLKFEPATFNNLFYYEDALDDEIEELLSALPKSSELNTKKHLLKVQLIERTTNTNELIKSTSAPASFKQQLVDSVSNSLPRKTANKEDGKQSHDELKIQKLVEDYILCANYKETDKAKSNVYRKKLIQEVQFLVNDLKKTQGKKMPDIVTDLYVNTIFNALQKVPLPSEETVKDEAEEILLGAEVDQWFADLAVVPNKDGNDGAQKKKIKDALIKRIREIENEVNIFDCTGERVLKHEISSFLEKVPLPQGENVNISYMAEEFANRMKNKAKELQAGNATRKSVAFMDSVGYAEFSQFMPYCSSFSEVPGARPAVANQSSYMIRDGTRVPGQHGYDYYPEPSLQPHVPLPSEEYFTLEDSQATPKAQQPAQQHNQYSKMSFIPAESIQGAVKPITPNLVSYREAVGRQPVLSIGSPERQQSPCCKSQVGSPAPLQTFRGSNVGQASRLSVQPHQFPSAPQVSMANIPPQAQTPCCARNQGDTSRNASITQQRPGTPVRTSMVYPEGATGGAQVQHRCPSIPPQNPRLSTGADQYPLATQSVPMADIPAQAQTPYSMRNQGNVSRIDTNQQPMEIPVQTVANPQGVPVVNHPQSPCTGPEQIPPQSDSFRVPQQVEGTGEANQQRGLGPISRIGLPQGFSTPQQVITQDSSPGPVRKRFRNSPRHRRNLERRRLELEDDTDGFESEMDEPCHCMDRMMRRRRPPVCYAYDDFEMDQCYPVPYGSLPMVTNNFTVQLCGDVRMKTRSGPRETVPGHQNSSLRNIKSVQTSFSSGDLVPAEKCKNCRRKIKSQEDLRDRDHDIQLQNEVLNWLRETDNSEVTSKWGEKMQRLAQKLAKPGGEEKIRQKIEKYLMRVPSQFSECDDETREFREQLPDSIIKKLKKIYLKPERRRNYSSPVRIFRIEIPKGYCNTKDIYKEIIRNWLKDIPIKKRDFHGKNIKKEDVFNSVVMKLEPYILKTQNFNKDNKSMLKATIMEILNEMPIEIDGFDKTSYCNRLALSLLNEIMHINGVEYYTEPCNIDAKNNDKHLKDISTFVLTQIANILNKLNLSASSKRLELLEEELKDSLLKVINAKEDSFSEATKDNVFTILYKLGGLSDYQANYFTDVILKHFKEEFGEKIHEKESPREFVTTNAEDEISFKDTYSVYHNTAKIKSDLSNKNSKAMNTSGLTINDEIRSNVVFNKRRLIVQIEDWLNELHIQIPFKSFLSRDEAVKELAEDIIDRFKYLELNPISKGSDESELQYLKYQIFKWINKVAGENTMETIEHAKDLMERIQNITNLVRTKEENSNIYSKADKLTYTQLNRVITDCLTNIGNEYSTEIVDDLASNLTRHLTNDVDKDAVINNEVEKWMKNVYKGKHKWVIKDKLLKSLKRLYSSRNKSNIDPKKEKIFLRKYEDVIDDWIDDLPKISKDSFKDRNKHTHELAVQLFSIVNSEDNSKSHLESTTIHWLEMCFGQRHFHHNYVSKFVDSILDCNNDILIEFNREERDEDNGFLNENLSNSRENGGHSTVENKIAGSNVAVYGVTLTSNPKGGNTNAGECSIQQINDDDVQASLDLYLKQLVDQIDIWLSTLNIPQIHDKGFREIVVNDLAGDIIDRHKYLEFNPSSRGTDESELEQLKYQIFKWINKLVGDDQQETVENASDLMNRIRSIPVPMLAKHSEPSENKSNLVTNRNVNSGNAKVNTKATPSNVRLSSPLGFTTGPMATTNKQNVVQMPLLSPQSRRGSVPVKSNVSFKDRRQSGPPALGIPKTPTQPLQAHIEEQEKGCSIDEVHQYFDIMLKERIKEIPLETPTPEQEHLADLAKKGLYNGIWKTYFQLKANPEIENDYSYFEMEFEDKLDKMLDCLPQTNEMQKMRQTWKLKVLDDVMSMLKYVHFTTDRPSFREMIEKKFNRRFVRECRIKNSNLRQIACVEKIANYYIMTTKYKEEDPMKAKIYMQRLMKTVDEFAEIVKSQANIEFEAVNKPQFIQMALNLLHSVPIPHNETLTDEVEEILIGEEVDQWYNGLPVQPVRNDTDIELRKRMKEWLARKVCQIEKRIDLDESAEQDLRQEVSRFLQDKAQLQKDVDLQIGFMVEELTNRLKNRRQQKLLGYESFEQKKPMSSTFAQTDPGEVLAPLFDAGVNAEGPSPHDLQEQDLCQRNFINQSQDMRGQSALSTSQAAGPSNQVPFHQSEQMPCCQGQGNLGTSEIAGPSGQVPFQGRMSQTPPPSYQDQGRRFSQVGGPVSQVPFQQQIVSPPPCCQDQSLLGRSQLPGPNGQGSYQQPLNQNSQLGHQRISQIVEPNQVFAPIQRPGNQSYQEPRFEHAPNRSSIPPNVQPCAQNLPPSQIGSDQVYQGNMLAPGQATTSSLPPGTEFMTDPSTGVTRSTARVASSVPNQEPMDEETDGEEEVRYKCRCLERVWKCKSRKHHYYEDNMGRPPRCYPMPFPCRYYY